MAARRFLIVACTVVLLTSCRSDSPQRTSVRGIAPVLHPVTVIGAQAKSLLATLIAAAPGADPDVIQLALRARGCALRHGATDASRLALIDYSRPSTQPRLWVFDLQRARLLYREYVAHGRNSGDNYPTRFSNVEGSLESSLGLFRTAETYEGDNGYSLRMDGLEPGFNDRARDRALVMHGAWYVDPMQAMKQGRLGRSLGCPALRPAVAHAVIDTLKQGQMLFAYYPDRNWLTRSKLLLCEGGTTADEPVDTRIHITTR